MEFFVSTSAPSRQRTDCAIVGVYDKGILTETAQAFDRKIGGRIARVVKRGDLRGKAGDTVLLTDIDGAASERILIVGLGARDGFKRKQFRKALGYPPFARMIQIRINGPDKAKTAERARSVGRLCERLQKERKRFASVQLMGPIEAPLARIANQYRWQILLKGPQAQALHALARALLSGASKQAGQDGTVLSVDVDPVFLM